MPVTTVLPAAAVDWAAARAIVARLQALLDDDDAEAVEVFHEHASVLRAILGDGFAAIDRLVSRYVLAEASEALRKALAQVEPLHGA